MLHWSVGPWRFWSPEVINTGRFFGFFVSSCDVGQQWSRVLHANKIPCPVLLNNTKDVNLYNLIMVGSSSFGRGWLRLQPEDVQQCAWVHRFRPSLRIWARVRHLGSWLPPPRGGGGAGPRRFFKAKFSIFKFLRLFLKRFF